MEKSSTAQLAKQTFLYGVPSILGRFLNYLLVPLYTYTLKDTGDYGIVSFLYGWIAIALVLLTFGMETGFFRFSKGLKDNTGLLNRVFTFILLISSLFILSIIGFREQISHEIASKNALLNLLLATVIVVLDALSSIPFAQLRFQNKALRFVSLKMMNIGLNILFNVIFFLIIPWMQGIEATSGLVAWYSIEDLVPYIFASNLIAALFTFLAVLLSVKGIRIDLSFKGFKPILKYSYPILLVGVAGILNQSGHNLIYPFLFDNATEGARQLGIYAANYKIGILMVLFTQAFRYAYEPFIFRQEGNRDSAKTHAQIMKYFLFVALLAFLGVTAFIDVLQYFVGPSYREGLVVVPIVLFSNLIFGLFFSLSVWYKLSDKTIYGAYFAFGGAIITLLGNILFVPVYGYIASAWTSLACYTVMTGLSFIYMRKLYPIPYQVKRLLLYTVIALVAYYSFQILNFDNEWFKYIYRTFILSLFVYIFIKIENINIKKLLYAKR